MATANPRLKQRNILEGPLLKNVILFIIPLIMTNMLQKLYHEADMIIVRLSGVEGALGAIGTTGAMNLMILNIAYGFGVGANVAIARWIGAGNRKQTENAVHTAVGLSVLCGLFFGAIGIALCRPILILLGDEGHILDMATTYSRVYFAGAPFVMITTFVAAIFRAKGDTKTPMYVLAFSGICNVVLNLFFVLVCKMSVGGVSFATVLSNVISTAILLHKLRKQEEFFSFEIKKVRLHKSSVQEIVRLGLPAGIQGALASLSKMTIQSSVLTMNHIMSPGGSFVIDGNTAGANIESIAYVIPSSVYQATVTFTSQHYGAGKLERIKKVIGACCLVGVLGTIAISGLVFAFKETIIGLYVTDPKAVEVASLRLNIEMIPYFIIAFLDVGLGFMRGLRRSASSALISLFGTCVFRVGWLMLVFPLFRDIAGGVAGLTSIYVCYPISWCITSSVTMIWGFIALKKEIAKQKASKAAAQA